MAIANMKRFLIVILLMAVLGVPGAGVVVAQDNGEETETVTVVSEEAINEASLRLSEALGFLIVFLGLWQIQGVAVSAFLEETVKPGLNKLVDSEVPFNDYVKTLVLLGAAFGYGAWQNIEGNVNTLEGAPVLWFEEMPAYGLAIMHGLMSVAMAFTGHRIWEVIISYAKRGRAALDAFGPRPSIPHVS